MGDCRSSCGSDTSKWSCSRWCRTRSTKLRWCDISEGGRRCCKCRCFPSTARLTLENGKSVMMSQLQKGDRVQTVSLDGEVKYSEVKTFLEIKHTVMATYLSITTSKNNTISMTGNHLLYVRKGSTGIFSPIYAEQVAIGDEVLVERNDYLTPAKVISVSSMRMQGAYAPLTKDGNIVVDGVLASCYANTYHDFSHLSMTPIRWFPEIMDWILGTQDGFPGYVTFAKDLANWVS